MNNRYIIDYQSWRLGLSILVVISNNDTIQNGISLYPNLHRAFDRGIITINSDYVVKIWSQIKENDSVFSLNQFEGKQISLPIDIKLWPHEEILKWHNNNRFI